MPESVKNRPSKSLEYIFLFCKARWVQNRESTLPKRISFEDARWLALLFDTEGNICARRHQRPDGKTQYGSQISVGMTSIALLNRAREIVGVGSLNERPGCNAPMYQWQLVARQASDLLRIIHPHLIVKRRQAQLVIHFQSLLRHRGNACRRTVEEEEELVRLWQMNKQLNHFGNPDMSGIPEPIELSRFGRWESQDYFCDMEAVKKSGKGGWSSASFLPDSAKDAANNGTPTAATGASRSNRSTDLVEEGTGRNYRNSDLWFESISAPHGVVGVGDEMVGTNVNPTGYGGAHFAVFSSKLIEPFIKMGTSERGVCAECGAPYRRLIKEEIIEKKPIDHSQRAEWDRSMDGALGDFNGQKGLRDGYEIKRTKTMGWEKTCQCSTLDTVPATVLDPFMGSGTTSVVSLRLGRRSIGIDLSLDYILKNQVPRIRGELASIPELRHLDPDRKVQRVSGGTSLLRKPQ